MVLPFAQFINEIQDDGYPSGAANDVNAPYNYDSEWKEDLSVTYQVEPSTKNLKQIEKIFKKDIVGIENDEIIINTCEVSEELEDSKTSFYVYISYDATLSIKNSVKEIKDFLKDLKNSEGNPLFVSVVKV